MIPYEELEKALARWKARRAGASDPLEATVSDAAPIGITPAAGYHNRESTGEIDLAADAVVDEN